MASPSISHNGSTDSTAKPFTAATSSTSDSSKNRARAPWDCSAMKHPFKQALRTCATHRGVRPRDRPRRRSAKLAGGRKATSPSALRKRLRLASSAGFSARRRSQPLRCRLSSFRQATLAGRHRASALGQTPPLSTCNSAPNAPVKRYEHLAGPRIQAAVSRARAL